MTQEQFAEHVVNLMISEFGGTRAEYEKFVDDIKAAHAGESMATDQNILVLMREDDATLQATFPKLAKIVQLASVEVHDEDEDDDEEEDDEEDEEAEDDDEADDE